MVTVVHAIVIRESVDSLCRDGVPFSILNSLCSMKLFIALPNCTEELVISDAQRGVLQLWKDKLQRL